MPIMSKKMSLSEPMMLVVILSFETISHFSSVFVTELWQFYLTQIVGACMICKFSVARSMLSKVRSIFDYQLIKNKWLKHNLVISERYIGPYTDVTLNSSA